MPIGEHYIMVPRGTMVRRAENPEGEITWWVKSPEDLQSPDAISKMDAITLGVCVPNEYILDTGAGRQR